MWIGRVERCGALWRACGTAQCREQLEEQAHDNQEETEHCPRKLAIGRRLMQRNTASPALQSTEFSTQHEQGSGIPGSLLDIIVKRIWIALLEIPQGCCVSRHFPNPKDHHPDDVEEQSKQYEALHTRPMCRLLSWTTGLCAIAHNA
jgi:hypothetical protein